MGYLFDLDDSRVCRNIQTLEPLLAKVMAIRKERHLSQQEVESLIVDATEQPIQRPQYRQKSFYSGKKKQHTNKTEICVTPKGRIVHVSKIHPGAVHDFSVYKGERPIHRDIQTLVDSGYQGMDKIHRRTEFPYKASKRRPLDAEEKQYNTALSRAQNL